MLKVIVIVFLLLSLAQASFVERFEKLRFKQKENAQQMERSAFFLLLALTAITITDIRLVLLSS